VSELFRRSERQAALAVEKLAEAAIFRAVGAANDTGGDEFARLSARAPALEPVFSTDRPVNGNGRDFGF